VETVITPAQDAPLGPMVPPARPDNARCSKGYRMAEVEAFYEAILSKDAPSSAA
jgi:hypothetical protein